MAADTVSERELPRASVGETLLVLTDVLAGLVARGVIARRPRVVALAELLDADRRAVKRMQRLRESHGRGPVVLALPVRTMALVLTPTTFTACWRSRPSRSSPRTSRSGRRCRTSSRTAC